MLQAADSSYTLRIFTCQTDLQASARIFIRKMAVPERPVFLQNMLFTLLSSFFYLAGQRPENSLKISTQGAFPFCEIAYAHNPHKLFLTRYRRNIGGGFLTRAARLLNYRWIALMESVAFKHAHVIVVPSEGLASELAETYSQSIAGKLRVIPNPVDCRAFAPSREPAAPRPFTFVFCALGNFEWKGLGLIIEALAGIPANLQAQRARPRPSCAFSLMVIGGKDGEIRRYRQFASSAGVADKVTFAGMQRDVRPYLWSSDVFVFPSVHESFGLVCLQAAAAGLPLITTDLYALDQLVQPGISGWRVERTVDSIRNAMQAALIDPDRTAQMGRNAQSLAQKYDVACFLEHWSGLIRSMRYSLGPSSSKM
jgi:glycosyltransferase involved in cell wall biosynthesis